MGSYPAQDTHVEYVHAYFTRAGKLHCGWPRPIQGNQPNIWSLNWGRPRGKNPCRLNKWSHCMWFAKLNSSLYSDKPLNAPQFCTTLAQTRSYRHCGNLTDSDTTGPQWGIKRPWGRRTLLRWQGAWGLRHSFRTSLNKYVLEIVSNWSHSRGGGG